MAASVIDFRRGSPAPDLLPVGILESAFCNLFKDSTSACKALDYGPAAGSVHVRDAIANWICRRYALSQPVSTRISISGGASQNLACLLQSYTNPRYTTRIFLVAPTYHLASSIFEDHGYKGLLRAVPEDDEGINIERLEHLMREDSETRPLVSGLINRSKRKLYRNVVYCVPSFSNPSGTTMTRTRREQLVRLARRFNALIVSDEVYDFLDWSEEHTANGRPPISRLVDIDAVLDGGPETPFGNTVSNGSFSKLLGPGLRVGWADATPAFISGLSLCGSSVSGGPPSQLTAWLAAASLQSGELDRHIDRLLNPALSRKSKALLDAVSTYLVPFGIETQPSILGGHFLYLALPKSIDAALFCYRAESEVGLLLASGRSFAVAGDEEEVHGRDRVRLCFAWESDVRLVEGVRRMATLLAAWEGD